ncbi:hypothetical protein ACSVHC_18140 [Arthrobacter sp. KNU-44]|uniref:hypothetical protein n=1 Tax=Arthrobacter sp. KNU-44 TaxID=3450744 RepID=UPI003F42F30D
MSGEVILNGFGSLAEGPAERERPTSVLPDPDIDAELDWVVVQIAVSADGGLTALQELRGWWDGNRYVNVPQERRCRTRVVSMGMERLLVEHDSSIV